VTMATGAASTTAIAFFYARNCDDETLRHSLAEHGVREGDDPLILREECQNRPYAYFQHWCWPIDDLLYYACADADLALLRRLLALPEAARVDFASRSRERRFCQDTPTGRKLPARDWARLGGATYDEPREELDAFDTAVVAGLAERAARAAACAAAMLAYVALEAATRLCGAVAPPNVVVGALAALPGPAEVAAAAP